MADIFQFVSYVLFRDDFMLHCRINTETATLQETIMKPTSLATRAIAPARHRLPPAAGFFGQVINPPQRDSLKLEPAFGV
jgi:hypothetical protein